MNKYLFYFTFLIAALINISSLEAEIHLNAKIYVAGHTGLVGSAIVRKLISEGYTNIITRSSDELDLRMQQDVNDFFAQEKPEYVFLAAAKVGGIKANMDYPADFIYTNLMIQSNIIEASYKNKVTKLLFLGSSCIYPRDCPQPIKEEYLLTSALEKTNKSYAVAKIAGIEMCQAYNRQFGTKFISCMPTNLYGPNDNYDINNSHVFPALIRKFVEARESNAESVTIWGTGTPKREFLHVDDLAQAVLFLMRQYDGDEIVNIGCGRDISIGELARKMKEIVGFKGELLFNASIPDGTPQKLLDISKIQGMGWEPQISLSDGIKETVGCYEEYRNKVKKA